MKSNTETLLRVVIKNSVFAAFFFVFISFLITIKLTEVEANSIDQKQKPKVDALFLGDRRDGELKPPKDIHRVRFPDHALNLTIEGQEALVDAVLNTLASQGWIGSHSLDDLFIANVYEIPETILADGHLRPKVTIVHLGQHMEDPTGKLEKIVMEGSFVRVVVKHFDKPTIVDVQTQLYDVPQPLGAVLYKETLIGIARRVLDLPKDFIPFSEREVMRYIRGQDGDGQWRRVFEFRYDDSGQRVIMDLHTGQFWTTSDIVFAESSLVNNHSNIDVTVDPVSDQSHLAPLAGSIHGQVQGMGVEFDPWATGEDLDVLRLKDLELTGTRYIGQDDVLIPSGTFVTYSRENGYFFFPYEPSKNYLVEAVLRGKWATVTNRQGDDLEASEFIFPGVPEKVIFNETAIDSSTTAQVNGYYHTSFIHDWVKERLSSLNEIDISLPVRVNDDYKSCNAAYDRGSILIKFTPEDEQCLNSAYDTIIYHEFGHFVDYMAGGKTSSSLGEGGGDVLAAFATSQPDTGEGLFKDSGYVRTADNDYQYPGLSDEEGAEYFGEDPHKIGQAWSGFAWHLREKLIENYGEEEGVEIAEYLIINTFLTNPQSIPDAVYDVLVLDADGGSYWNETPHGCLIYDAANQHDIPIDDHWGMYWNFSSCD